MLTQTAITVASTSFPFLLHSVQRCRKHDETGTVHQPELELQVYTRCMCSLVKELSFLKLSGKLLVENANRAERNSGVLTVMCFMLIMPHFGNLVFVTVT